MEYFKINLQLFADGGEGSDSGEGNAATVASSDSVAAAQTAQVTEQSADNTIDKSAAFENLIKGEYKDEFDKRTKKILDKRFKTARAAEEQLANVSPVLDLLSQRYGVDASDMGALTKAVQDDDAMYENIALELGVDNSTAKEFVKLKAENSRLERAESERKRQEEADKVYAQWAKEADATAAIYPGFDIQQELENESFSKLIKNGVDVKTAFEVVHKDEILPAAMQFASQKAEANVVNAIAANANRPAENGIANNSAAISAVDVNKLTPQQIEEYKAAAQRGEHITFK